MRISKEYARNRTDEIVCKIDIEIKDNVINEELLEILSKINQVIWNYQNSKEQ